MIFNFGYTLSILCFGNETIVLLYLQEMTADDMIPDDDP
jgi:hypothetical protein